MAHTGSFIYSWLSIFILARQCYSRRIRLEVSFVFLLIESVRSLLSVATRIPRSPFLSPTNFRNSERPTVTGLPPSGNDSGSSYTPIGEARCSTKDRGKERAVSWILREKLIYRGSLKQRMELIRFRELVGKNITRIYIYIFYLPIAITKITRGDSNCLSCDYSGWTDCFIAEEKLRIFWKRY